ncbi:Glucose--fructose oxidoreductase precursor [Planctomycetes bacterium Poly30]|uniref:Glucose--fructose oxidoreductase n=1 Tax=Saltatorellus ferox TaxID=2528018 RepID=A0A518EZM8_9BACT|nr:Glucose--fructose oxidoreductase precursor [Planctomycetes bacterium Poly30]
MKIAGISFDHMHMGDNLRFAHEHPHVDLVGVCDGDPARMQPVIESLSIPASRVYTDARRCIEETDPDLILLCPSTGSHAEWVERLAPFGKAVMIEKPFAASLEEADRMIRAMERANAPLAINWPLAWQPAIVTAKRLTENGVIGAVTHVHYYGGNRGPLYHLEGKRETTEAFRAEQKRSSWFYRRDSGGGSLLDYLGYGATFGTWFLGGLAPLEVTCVTHVPEGLEVDEHSITIARYAHGLCRFETRWGTFTDPWTHQPQPKCGFEIVGEHGTISSYDHETTVRVQTRERPEGTDIPVDRLESPFQNPVQYMVHCLEQGLPIEGPLSPSTSRIGQQIVDTAARSAREKRTLPLDAIGVRRNAASADPGGARGIAFYGADS